MIFSFCMSNKKSYIFFCLSVWVILNVCRWSNKQLVCRRSWRRAEQLICIEDYCGFMAQAGAAGAATQSEPEPENHSRGPLGSDTHWHDFSAPRGAIPASVSARQLRRRLLLHVHPETRRQRLMILIRLAWLDAHISVSPWWNIYG